MTIPLVVSFIGYESQIIDKLILQANPVIKLKPEATNLEEVIVSDDDWSRTKKLGYFKREFIGHSIYSKDCKITNLDKENIINYYINSKSLDKTYIKFKELCAKSNIRSILINSGKYIPRLTEKDETFEEYITIYKKCYQIIILLYSIIKLI